jgi:hypothetical protein
MRERMGSGLELRMLTTGFDVISTFAEILQLPGEPLANVAAAGPNTQKRTWKEQVVFANLSEVERRLGCSIGRRRLMAFFDAGVVLPGDMTNYTLYVPGEQERFHADFLRIAQAHGLTAYADAFAKFTARAVPSLSLDQKALTDEDLSVIAALLNGRARVRDQSSS